MTLKRGSTLVLSQFQSGISDMWCHEPEGLEELVEDVADQFKSGTLEPDTFEVIEVQVLRRRVVRAALQVTVRGDK